MMRSFRDQLLPCPVLSLIVVLSRRSKRLGILHIQLLRRLKLCRVPQYDHVLNYWVASMLCQGVHMGTFEVSSLWRLVLSTFIRPLESPGEGVLYCGPPKGTWSILLFRWLEALVRHERLCGYHELHFTIVIGLSHWDSVILQRSCAKWERDSLTLCEMVINTYNNVAIHMQLGILWSWCCWNWTRSSSICFHNSNFRFKLFLRTYLLYTVWRLHFIDVSSSPILLNTWW